MISNLPSYLNLKVYILFESYLLNNFSILIRYVQWENSCSKSTLKGIEQCEA